MIAKAVDTNSTSIRERAQVADRETTVVFEQLDREQDHRIAN